MTQITSINQIVKLFNDLVDDHLQINDFGYGELYDLYTSRNMNYPILWLTHNEDSYIRLSNKNLVNEMSLSIFIGDQVNDQSNYEDINGLDSNNGQEIMSDTLEIVKDIINYINTSNEFRDLGISLFEDDDVQMSPSMNELTDKVNGWLITFTLKVKYINCNPPIS